MKNFEKYIDELKRTGDQCRFITEHLQLEKPCWEMNCYNCKSRFFKWLDSEYIPEIDWSKVPVDTPVVVTLRDGTKLNRYFAKYKDNNIYTFLNGATSWSIEDKSYLGAYFGTRNVELARPEDIEKYSI